MTPARRLKKPSLSLMCNWIVAVWKLIPENMVMKNFKVTSISNAMDRIEDNAVWHASSERENTSDVDSDSESNVSSEDQ